MSKLWILVISSFLVSLNAQAGMSADQLMKASAQVVIENGLHLQMPACAGVKYHSDFPKCVISQGWGDFNSESYDPTHRYSEDMYIVFFLNKGDHQNPCHVEVLVDAAEEKVISQELDWVCIRK